MLADLEARQSGFNLFMFVSIRLALEADQAICIFPPVYAPA